MESIRISLPIEPKAWSRSGNQIIWPSGTKKYFKARSSMVDFLDALINKNPTIDWIRAKASVLYANCCYEGPPNARKDPFVMHYTPTDMRHWQDSIKSLAREYIRRNLNGFRPLEVPLEVTIWCILKSPGSQNLQSRQISPIGTTSAK